tara:strand:- start:654 stop:767 length:114 start_codon:yes stop_codon:yes gene_type:complete
MHNDKENGFCFAYEVRETPDKSLGVYACERIEKVSIV